MKRRFALSGFIAAAALVAGCASPTPNDYAAEKPLLDLKTYFSGELVAHGLFTDRAGKVARRFVVQMTGTWQGKNGTLDERFTYSDGSTERRIWRLTDEGNGRWTGRADDVVGVAEGQSAGNALNWRYTLKLPVDAPTSHTVRPTQLRMRGFSATGYFLVKDKVTSPSRMPNLLITALFSITRSSIRNIQSSNCTS